MSTPSPLKGGLSLGCLGCCNFPRDGGRLCLVSIDSKVCYAVDPKMVVYLSPFHIGVADDLEPELFVIEQPAQPMVYFGGPDNDLLIGQHGRELLYLLNCHCLHVFGETFHPFYQSCDFWPHYFSIESPIDK